MLLPALLYIATASSGLADAGTTHDAIRTPRISTNTITSASTDSAPQLPRLTVRPKEMATGKETSKAGLTPLEGFAGYLVYVPTQCVGKKRAPLIVMLHGGGRSGAQEMAKFQVLADKYGMIVLAGNALQPGRWDVIGGMMNRQTTYTTPNGNLLVSSFPERDVRHLDSAITLVLRTHAIDPERMALLGFSDGGSYSLFLGRSNLDVFSRIAALSALIPFDGIGPTNTKTQFFLSGGTGEGKMAAQTLKLAQKLRQRGHAVVTQIGLRGHVDHVEDETFIWEWLQQSWADPSITTKVPKEPAADPVLTEDAIQKVSAFWKRLKQEPDSIRNAGRMKHQMQLPLALGDERTTVVTTNIPAMAAAYPSMAAILDSLGVTAAQMMAYRTSIIRTGIARMAGITSGAAPADSSKNGTNFAPVAPTSVLGKNLEFWNTHEAVFTELERAGFLQVQ